MPTYQNISGRRITLADGRKIAANGVFDMQADIQDIPGVMQRVKPVTPKPVRKTRRKGE